jgi:peptidoglycan/xylan/chitin deacetylase (PgdA/CDA1 family)
MDASFRFELPTHAPRLWRGLNEARLALLGPLAFGGAACRGPLRRRAVALTFDDGPDPEITPLIVAALDAANARGTFFFAGEALERHPDVGRLAAARHEIGTHLYAHDRAMTRSVAAFEEEATRSLAVHERILGERPVSLRYPFGDSGRIRRSDAQRLGLEPYHWTFSSEDSSAPSADAIVRHVVPRLHAGAIVLLHDGRGPNSRHGSGPRRHTLAALPAILSAATARGLRCVTVRDLFGR